MSFSTVANSPAITPIEKQRRGLLRIVLTNFENQSADEVGAGSVVEQGGSLYYADANTAISGLTGISNSSHYWIKLVPSGSDLTPTATTTPPTWSNTKHGWYDGNDLYIGGGYKDASGNYTDKYLFHFAQYSLKSLSDGLSLRGNSNADRRIVFADDAEILWDESEDEFYLNKALKANGNLKLGTGSADRNIQFATDANIFWDESQDRFEPDKSIYLPPSARFIGRHLTNIFYSNFTTENAVFDALSPYIPTNGDKMMISGMVEMDGESAIRIISHAERISSTQINLNGGLYNYSDTSTVAGVAIIDGSSDGLAASLAW